jgi:hypothetical protein
MVNSLSSLVKHIVLSDYVTEIKHTNRYVVKSGNLKPKWVHYKTLKSSDEEQIHSHIQTCKYQYPESDILLKAYDSDTEMIEIYKIL